MEQLKSHVRHEDPEIMSISHIHVLRKLLSAILLFHRRRRLRSPFPEKLNSPFVSSSVFPGVEPEGIIGHSVGELGCAYADGSFTAEEVIKAAYWRGIVKRSFYNSVAAGTHSPPHTSTMTTRGHKPGHSRSQAPRKDLHLCDNNERV